MIEMDTFTKRKNSLQICYPSLGCGSTADSGSGLGGCCSAAGGEHGRSFLLMFILFGVIRRRIST